MQSIFRVLRLCGAISHAFNLGATSTCDADANSMLQAQSLIRKVGMDKSEIEFAASSSVPGSDMAEEDEAPAPAPAPDQDEEDSEQEDEDQDEEGEEDDLLQIAENSAMDKDDNQAVVQSG